MSLRKLLANSDKEFWQFLSLPMILGTFLVIPIGVLLPVILPLFVWLKIVLFLIDLTGIFYYLRLTGFAISMGSPYMRPNYFIKGDLVTRDGKRYFEVKDADYQFFWLEDNWINYADGSWKLYNSTKFERLLCQ